MINFTIDIDKWVNNMLPTSKRKTVFKAFFKVLAKPFLAYYGISDTFYQSKLNEIAPLLLTDELQNKLRNDYPNVGAFKVFVKTQWDVFPQGYIKYLSEHQKPEYDGYLAEISSPEYDAFIAERNLPHDYYVIVPVAYTANQTVIELVLNKYKPAGKRYLLIFDNITI